MPTYENRLRKSEWFVEPIAHRDAFAFVSKHHYAKGMSRTAIYCHGLFDELGILLGAASWLCPTQFACKTVDPDDWKRVISLSRLCIHPSVPKNACSFVMARSIDFIRRDGRFRTLVSYADSAHGHTGHIYRCSGWTYFGLTSATPQWVDPLTGRQHSLKSTRSRTKQELIDLGYEMRGRFVKHKFVKYLDRSMHKKYCEL